MDNEELMMEEETFGNVDKLFDEDNDDLIYLTDNEGKEWAFDQLAVVPHEGVMYALLHQHDGAEDTEESTAVSVFAIVINEEGEGDLEMVEDEDLSDAVFEKFVAMLDETEDEE